MLPSGGPGALRPRLPTFLGRGGTTAHRAAPEVQALILWGQRLRAAAQEDGREEREGRGGRQAALQPRGRATEEGLRRLHTGGIRRTLPAHDRPEPPGRFAEEPAP